MENKNTGERFCTECSKRLEKTNKKQICSHECHLVRRRKWHAKNREKINARQREEYHNGTRKQYAKDYEKTFFGHLMRMYRNMKSRTLGIQKMKAHLYQGKELLSKEQFYEWAQNHKDYKRLYKKWVASGYERRLVPTVDRIDSNKGYVIDNMRWLTHSENSRLGSESLKRKRAEQRDSLNSVETQRGKVEEPTPPQKRSRK